MSAEKSREIVKNFTLQEVVETSRYTGLKRAIIAKIYIEFNVQK
jgi:hypothetical protein